MAKDSQKYLRMAMYRRWVYMAVAITISALLLNRSVFNFQDDKGIIYVRSFSMNQMEFTVTQTELETGLAHEWTTMSTAGLYYCDKAMLWGSILCLLCFFSDRWRIWIATLTAFIAGAYYIILIYYAMKISDLHYATFYPNFMVFMPAIVCQMMVLTRQNVIRSSIEKYDIEMEQ